MHANGPASVFEAGDVPLSSGRTLRGARLSYRTYGTLSPARDNVVLYPTSYAAQHVDTEWLIEPDGILDPRRWFVVIPDMLGNGLSSSPSNTAPPFDRGRCPTFSILDNVRVQRRLLREVLGVERIALAYGWSMGGMQAYQWASSFPDEVERIAVVCGAARCAPHNHVFLEGVKAALTADPAWRGDGFDGRPERGLRAMGRVYAGWALSQAFYRDRLWTALGYTSLEDWLVGAWEGNFLRRDAHDLLAQIHTWQHSSIADDPAHGGDFERALRAISAEVLLMPGRTDLYFRTEDNAAELRHLARGRLEPIESDWGHRAGNPTHRGADRDFVRDRVRELTAR
ncbi:MAG TPA: alpha/beta fold hydrolase [Burkholderiaceae bacterium]|nr:alpha/beta fold hydrolase [Burkholderiaceae bacterium]